MIISQANTRLPDVATHRHFIIYKNRDCHGKSLKRSEWRSIGYRNEQFYNFTLEFIYES